MTPKPTQELKSSVNSYLLARANAELHREKVDVLATEILTSADYFPDPKWTGRRGLPNEPIKNPKDAYLLTDEEHTDYLLDLRAALQKSGYEIKSCEGEPESSYYCPALVAESLQRKTERLVINSMAEILGESNDFHQSLICAGLEKYHKFIDLSVKFVVNQPDFKNPLS